MAGRKPLAPRTRNALLAIQRKLVQKGATKEAMMAAFQEQHQEILRDELPDIVRLGLMTITNSICNLKLGANAGLQIELFEGYDVPRTVTLHVPDATGKMQKVSKAFGNLTKAEARKYVTDHTTPRPKKRSRTVEDIQRVLDFIGDSGADDWTLKRCWKAAQDDAAAL